MAQWLRVRLPMPEMQIQSLGQEDPLEVEMASHFRTVAQRILWTEKPGKLQSMGLQRVGHGLATEHEHVDKKTKYFTLSKEISKTLIIKHLKSKNHFIIV